MAWRPDPNPASRRNTVVKAELGTKRTCPSCAVRFYDLLKDPITCPKCGTSFIPAVVLPSRGDMPGAPPPKPVPVPEEVAAPADVELVSLEEAEGPQAEDETAGIEDVDLGEEAESTEGEDETFLEQEEEEGGDMSNLIEGGGGKEDEEET
jgi:uncharacterized protein (TIGR02300 family)